MPFWNTTREVRRRIDDTLNAVHMAIEDVGFWHG